jgi:hypothetical protein
MGAVGEEFLGGGRALGARSAEAEADAGRDLDAGAERARERVEPAAHGGGAGDRALLGAQDRAFVAAADLRLDAARVELLEREHAILLGLALGQEGLFADDVEVAQEQLAADRAAPAAALALDEFEPRLVAVVEEARADRALLVDLGMGIVGIAGAEADALEEIAARVDLGAHVRAGLLDVQADLLGFDVGIEREADGTP